MQLDRFHALREAFDRVFVRGLNLEQIRVALAEHIKCFQVAFARLALCALEIRNTLQVVHALLLEFAKLCAQCEPRRERKSGVAQLRRSRLKARWVRLRVSSAVSHTLRRKRRLRLACTVSGFSDGSNGREFALEGQLSRRVGAGQLALTCDTSDWESRGCNRRHRVRETFLR